MSEESPLDVEFEPHKPIEPINDLRQAAHMMSEKGILDDEPAEAAEEAPQEEEIQAEAQDEDDVDEQVQVEAEAEVEEVAEEDDSEEAAPEPKVPSKSEIELALERERTKQERQHATAVLQQYLDQIGNPKAPEAGLIDEDPMEYMRQNAKFAEQQAQRQQAEAQLGQLQQQQYQDFIQEETGKLKADLPQLYDGEKGEVLRQEIGQFAAKNGYTQEQLAWATAHDIKMLYAAMSYEKLQSKAPQKKVELQSKPKVLKPQAAATPKDPNAEALKAKRASFKKSGHVNDFAALLAEGDLL